LLEEASPAAGRSLLAPEVKRILLPPTVPEAMFLDAPLGDLVWRFLRSEQMAPVLVYAHNICWRYGAYIQAHLPGVTTTSTPLGPGYLGEGDRAMLRPRPTGFQLEVDPALLPWRDYHEDTHRQIGYTLMRTQIASRRPGRDPVITMHHRLFVGNDAAEFRPFLKARIVPACERLGYQLGRGPKPFLLPFVVGISDPTACGVLDAQLFKLRWLWRVFPESRDPMNVCFDELVLMFDRRDGGLLSIGTCSGCLLDFPRTQLVLSDWGGWLATRFGIDAVAR
jgi:hypothetical protein